MGVDGQFDLEESEGAGNLVAGLLPLGELVEALGRLDPAPAERGALQRIECAPKPSLPAGHDVGDGDPPAVERSELAEGRRQVLLREMIAERAEAVDVASLDEPAELGVGEHAP